MDIEHPCVRGPFAEVVVVGDGQWGLPVVSLVYSFELLVGYAQ